MSQDFQKVLVRDDRLDVKDTIKYAVNKGAQNVTSSEFRANSQSNSSHTYTIQVPSEQTVIDREVLWTSTVQLKLSGKLNEDGLMLSTGNINLFNYGLTDALAPFPLHSLVNVMQCTINNNTISQNTADILPQLTRMIDRKSTHKYNGYTPCGGDPYSSYVDGVGKVNNSLGAYGNSLDTDFSPRGAWALDSISTASGAKPGVFDLPEISAQDTTVNEYYVTFTVTEPLLISPFIFGHPVSNNQGFYGIENMTFVMNMGQTNRVWRRSAGGPGVQEPATVGPWQQNGWIEDFTVELVNFKNSNLKFNFLTPHASDLMPSRNVVGFYEMPRYITSLPESISNRLDGDNKKSGLVSTTVTLNQVPDKLIICVKKAVANQTNFDPDFFYAIKSLRIDWNNQSGLLSNASTQEIYNMSVENGSNQSWLEFKGVATRGSDGQPVGTTGSMVVLEFGKDIQLTEDYYAPGSLGNFTLRVSVDIENQTEVNTTSDKPLDLSIITQNSGIFVSERGSSSIYTGILTKQDVLDASKQTAWSKSDVKRMTGGGFLDNLKAIGSKSVEHLPGVAKAVGQHLLCGSGEVGAGLVGAGRKRKADSRCL